MSARLPNLTSAALALTLGIATGCDAPDPAPLSSEELKMQCADGIIISQAHATILRPDREGKVAVLISGPRFEDGIAAATITVSFPGTNKPGADRPLKAGESVSPTEVGTFTLLDVKIIGTQPGLDGGGNLAVYCFRPTPAFDLDTDRLTWTKDQ